MWTAPTRGLPKWSSSEATDENKASLERRCGDCRACALRASLGATSQSIGRKLDGRAGSQPRWAGSDALQRGRTSIGFGLRHNLGDAAEAPSCARPPCGEHSRDAPCPWPQVGDGYHRTAQPSRARPAPIGEFHSSPGPARPRNGPACLGRNEPDASRRESDIEPDRWSLRPGP
jgi:hypothetical protein